MKDMLENGGNPASHFEWWQKASQVSGSDRSVHEMEVLCRTLHAMATVDQLNVPSLTSAEMLCRRIALIKEAHRVSPDAPDYSASDYFMGWGARKMGATVAPAITASVATAISSDAAVAKEARKAREEKVLRGASKKKKGKGKGKDPPADGADG